MHATRAAVAEGIVPGGGVALLTCCKSLDKLKLTGDEAIGADIIRQAAFAPATAIANNCGKQGNLIAEKIYEAKGAFGYNGLTDEFTDLKSRCNRSCTSDQKLHLSMLLPLHHCY